MIIVLNIIFKTIKNKKRTLIIKFIRIKYILFSINYLFFLIIFFTYIKTWQNQENQLDRQS